MFVVPSTRCRTAVQSLARRNSYGRWRSPAVGMALRLPRCCSFGMDPGAWTLRRKRNERGFTSTSVPPSPEDTVFEEDFRSELRETLEELRQAREEKRNEQRRAWQARQAQQSSDTQRDPDPGTDVQPPLPIDTYFNVSIEGSSEQALDNLILSLEEILKVQNVTLPQACIPRARALEELAVILHQQMDFPAAIKRYRQALQMYEAAATDLLAGRDAGRSPPAATPEDKVFPIWLLPQAEGMELDYDFATDASTGGNKCPPVTFCSRQTETGRVLEFTPAEPVAPHKESSGAGGGIVDRETSNDDSILATAEESSAAARRAASGGSGASAEESVPELARTRTTAEALDAPDSSDKPRPATKRSTSRLTAASFHMARVLSYLGVCYRDSGRLQKALDMLKASLKIKYRTVGQYHESTAESLNNIGALCFSLNDYVKAADAYEDCVQVLIGCLGGAATSSPLTAMAYYNLGLCYAYQDHCAVAAITLSKANRVAAASFGENHSITARIRTELELVKRYMQEVSHGRLNKSSLMSEVAGAPRVA